MLTTEALDPTDRLLAERACERLIIEFVHKLDLGDPGEVAELFVDDGVWEWAEGDRRIQGRDALRSYFAGRPADRLSRRMCTNILVTLTSETTATATTYFTTYRVDGYANGFVPPRIPTQVGHYEDTFLKVNGLWLLRSRSLFLAFAGPTESLEPVTKP
ncbi:nuclear transport factor 2 family protein [Streptomyces sp. NBC_00264]|uniref:nuclear transport factor 2 family protein n=1 Tax=unclassified Streptomyces TaxID=2593676 RepID=UPI0022500B20|nr:MULTISPECIES: nuclear transport factor 2 family protein [unclassified Streptomyces]MCX5157894.1 nuclear transport factor 2 family protein [Streptomyces sp. NBC_00305]MCX5216417.1 nuclear transport factor 2 family protein [Streptomyces sp. NBC_00264]